MNDKFAGHLKAFKQDVERNDEDTVIEVTDLEKSGEIEIAFNDRNERVYLRFTLSDLMSAMCASQVAKD